MDSARQVGQQSSTSSSLYFTGRGLQVCGAVLVFVERFTFILNICKNLHICTYTVCTPGTQEGDIGNPETGARGVCELPGGCWK